MRASGFILTSEECELLLVLENHPGLEKLSVVTGRDASNISRSLTRIAEKMPVVEKKAGRWALTSQGLNLNQQTRDAIAIQHSIVQNQATLKIGTNREFAARILGPRLPELQNILPGVQLRISSFESGTEQALLNGTIDLAFDCDRPFDPEISYKLIVKEAIVAVCAPEFRKKFSKEIHAENLFGIPHLLCDRLFPDRILGRRENQLKVVASFNDIATTRAACVSGSGWALLPQYSVALELEQKKLVELEIGKTSQSQYGVWWLRRRKYLDASAMALQSWLKHIEL